MPGWLLEAEQALADEIPSAAVGHATAEAPAAPAAAELGDGDYSNVNEEAFDEPLAVPPAAAPAALAVPSPSPPSLSSSDGRWWASALSGWLATLFMLLAVLLAPLPPPLPLSPLEVSPLDVSHCAGFGVEVCAAALDRSVQELHVRLESVTEMQRALTKQVEGSSEEARKRRGWPGGRRRGGAAAA